MTTRAGWRVPASTMTRHLALAVALFLAAGLAACRAEPPAVTVVADKGTIGHGLVVTGTATLQVSPDCADLTMTVTATAPRPGAAVEQVRARQAALVAALRRRGAADADLALSTVSIAPHVEWIEQRSVAKGYDARITITVTTRKLDQIAALMEAGADAGVTEMTSQLRRSDLETLKAKVREQALLAARDKARRTAATLELDLGRITAVAEQSPSPLYSGAYVPRVANVVTAEAAAGQPLAGEAQALTLDVTVTYDLPART
jgi:uncharacterized protein YggE